MGSHVTLRLNRVTALFHGIERKTQADYRADPTSDVVAQRTGASLAFSNFAWREIGDKLGQLVAMLQALGQPGQDSA